MLPCSFTPTRPASDFAWTGFGERREALLELQRLAGNRAVNRLFEPPIFAVPTARPAAPDFAELIRNRDISGIKATRAYGSATQSQRIRMVEILLDQSWVGPLDEAALEAIWNSFGNNVLTVAQQNQSLWDRCIERGAELHDIAVVRRIRTVFERDVKALAHAYMRRNRQAVVGEAARLGLGDLKGRSPSGGALSMTAGRVQRGEGADLQAVARAQKLAREAERADQVLRRLREIPVGYDWDVIDHPGGARRATRVVANYSPGHRPMVQPGPGEQGFSSYEDVHQHYQAVQRARAAVLARNPAVFAAAQQGEAGNIARQSPQAAAATLRGVLAQTLTNINETEPKLDSGDLDWRDLVPLHSQLFRGLPSASGTPWNQGIYRGVARDVIGDYQATQFWITLGLATAAAAAFIVSEVATAGMATFLWASAGMAVSAAQAAVSWERYEDLATAEGAATSEETRLVSEGQVSEALTAAVLDTAFAFVDAFAAARGVATAVRATAARQALTGLGRASGTEAREIVERAVRELGAQETMRRSGRSAEELIQVVGGNSDAGRALQSAARDVTVSPRAVGEAAAAATPEARRLAGRLQSLFERWRTMSPMERLEELSRQVQGEAAHSGMPPLSPVVLDRGPRGQMTVAQWELAVRRSLIGDSNITPEAFASLVDTARHEVQHGAQWFRMAQLEAMRTGDSAAEIARRLGMPEEVVDAAIEVQVGRRAGTRLAEGSSLAAKAEAFFDSVYGAGRAARRARFQELDAASDGYRQASRRWDAVRLAEESSTRQSARRELEAAWTRLDRAHHAYRALPEEADAFRAGGAAGAAVRERMGILGRLQSARRAEQAAYNGYRPLEDLYISVTARPNHHLAYDRLLAYYQAMDRWKRSLNAVSSLERALSRYSRGMAPRL